MKIQIIINVLTSVVALLHTGFLVLEMFLWTHPIGMKIFRLTPEKAADSAALAMNQGLYNGFLVAGLVWGLMHPDPVFGRQIKIFFLACVVAAGIYGAWTVNSRIFFVQAAPALLPLALILVL